jgi:hypothetical protein
VNSSITKTAITSKSESSSACLRFLRIVIIAFIALYSSMSHKAFAAENFDFSTHCEPAEMMGALRKLLPQGTDRAMVEDKLVKEGGATAQVGVGRPNLIYYSPPANCSSKKNLPLIVVMYDAHDRVRQITAGGPPVFPETPPPNRTDATIFSFNDYDSGDDLLATLNVLFPPGTPKSRVDEVLVNWVKAVPLRDADYPDTYSYFRSINYDRGSDGQRLRHRVWNVSVSYGTDNTVHQLWVTDQQCSGGHPSNTEYLTQKATTGNAADFMNELRTTYHPSDVTKCWALSPETHSAGSQAGTHTDPQRQPNTGNGQ